jgi:Flp pilus assembly CpaF family ATPase
MVGMDWHNDGRKNNVVPEEVVPEDGFKYCFTVPTHALVLRRNNKIFITGNSGKSTALNAFIEYIPKTRESLVIQENDELFTSQSGFMFKHPTYNFHGEGVCTLEDLGKMALVEGCNEFIVGEVKGGEMRYVMTLMNAGGYSALTVHSTNAYETLDKMADLVKYGSSYSFDEARRMLKAFDTVVYMEGYKIREILEVNGYDDDRKDYNYINIYRYEG